MLLLRRVWGLGLKRFELTEAKLSDEAVSNFSNNSHDNIYEVSLADELILENKIFFLVFESSNPEFKVSILDGNKSRTQKFQVLMDLQTFTGNLMMVMSETYFNNRLSFFKDTGFLRFFVQNASKVGETDYKVKVSVGDSVDLVMGMTYTTRVDYMQNNFDVNLLYNGRQREDLKKLRFQLTSVR